MPRGTHACVGSVLNVEVTMEVFRTMGDLLPGLFVYCTPHASERLLENTPAAKYSHTM